MLLIWQSNKCTSFKKSDRWNSQDRSFQWFHLLPNRDLISSLWITTSVNSPLKHLARSWFGAMTHPLLVTHLGRNEAPVQRDHYRGTHVLQHSFPHKKHITLGQYTRTGSLSLERVSGNTLARLGTWREMREFTNELPVSVRPCYGRGETHTYLVEKNRTVNRKLSRKDVRKFLRYWHEENFEILHW